MPLMRHRSTTPDQWGAESHHGDEDDVIGSSGLDLTSPHLATTPDQRTAAKSVPSSKKDGPPRHRRSELQHQVPPGRPMSLFNESVAAAQSLLSANTSSIAAPSSASAAITSPVDQRPASEEANAGWRDVGDENATQDQGPVERLHNNDGRVHQQQHPVLRADTLDMHSRVTAVFSDATTTGRAGADGEERPLSAAELIAAIGQSLTPSALADRERLMHERRMMAYHNTRLVLALQRLGAVGAHELEALQASATVLDEDMSRGRPGGCHDCRAAHLQMRSHDQALARASLSVESAKEQIKACQRQRDHAIAECRTLRASVMRCEELLETRQAELTALRLQVSHCQPAIEELQALRRTSADLAHRIKVLQSAEPVVRIIHARSRKGGHGGADKGGRHEDDGTEWAASDAVPTVPAAVEDAASASCNKTSLADTTNTSSRSNGVPSGLRELELQEEAARVDTLRRFFNFHHLAGLLRTREGQSLELQHGYDMACREREQFRERADELETQLRHISIERKTEATRIRMMEEETRRLRTEATGLRRDLRTAEAEHLAFVEQQQQQLPVVQQLLPAGPQEQCAGATEKRNDAARLEALEAEATEKAWSWALARVRSTLDDAMHQIQAQVDDAYAQGLEAGAEQQRHCSESEPLAKTPPHRPSSAKRSVVEPENAETGPSITSIGSVPAPSPPPASTLASSGCAFEGSDASPSRAEKRRASRVLLHRGTASRRPFDDVTGATNQSASTASPDRCESTFRPSHRRHRIRQATPTSPCDATTASTGGDVNQLGASLTSIDG